MAGRAGSASGCLLAAILVAAAYGNHFHNDFHFDDDHTIRSNLYVRDVRNIPRFFTTTTTFSSLPANQAYRPLVTTTLAIDYWRGGGLRPATFHATSFALFVIQCTVMFVLFRRLMDHARPDAANPWVALAATTAYALHPANAETVNYIIARSEILSTLGVVLALVMFAAGGRLRRWGLYLVPAAAGMLGKEQAAMFAPLLFLYVAFFERELSARELLRPREVAAVLRVTWPAFLVCGALAAVGLHVAATFDPGGRSQWHYLITQPIVILRYVTTFFLPVHLTADTDWTPITNALDYRVIVGVTFIAGVLALAVIAARRRETRPVAFGVLWFVVALLPTSSVVPLAEVTNDHRVYFPFVGLTLAVVWAAALPLRRLHTPARRLVASAAVVLLIALAYGTHRRNEVWRTEESLWLDVTRKSPANGRGLMTYGVIQMGKGNLAVAQEYFERALLYAPQYAYLHVNLGILKGARGEIGEAERHFLEAQRYDPRNPVSYFYYARWLGSVGRSEEAIAQVRRAIDLSPAHADARELLRDLLARPTAASIRSHPPAYR